MAIWGTDCGRVKMSGKMIKSVSAKNGEESKLYKDILEHLDTLPKEELDTLRESFRDWEGEYVGDVDNKKHLALALYAKTTSSNFKNYYLDSPVDKNNEPLFERSREYLMGKVQITKQEIPKEGGFKQLPKKEGEVRTLPKSVEVSQTPKAQQEWNKLQKGNINFDQFLQNSQFPKEQKELLRDIYNTEHPNTVGELVTSMVAKYSYTVEINTAKSKDIRSGYEAQWGITDADKTDEDYQKGEERPTQYYSNLTVPGGTNYTENEIATPDIIPSIKGHAQFSTDNGIGWFRSDESVSSVGMSFEPVIVNETGDNIEAGPFKNTKEAEKYAIENNIPLSRISGSSTTTGERFGSKTRRILEVQSDLFQKGRDKEDLVLDKGDYKRLLGFTYTNSKGNIIKITNVGKTSDTHKPFINFTVDGKQSKGILLEKALKQPLIDEVLNAAFDNNGNQFLQLLNKNGNWVPFFIKSIIQDSAKKGYEKVLFPTGNTASKVEGHQTLEDFKKQKENRLKDINKQLEFEDFDVDIHTYVNTHGVPLSHFIELGIENGKNNSQILKDIENYYNGADEEWLYFNYSYARNYTPEYYGDEGPSPVTTFDSFESMIHRTGINLSRIVTASRDREYLIREKKQLNKELERVETEGFAALKPIYNFYENRVYRELEKMYTKEGIARIKDTYGNEWYEVDVVPEVDKGIVFYQLSSEKQETRPSRASDATVDEFKEFLQRKNIKLNVLTKGRYDETGKEITPENAAYISQRLVNVIDGEQATALPEEASHHAVQYIKQYDPKLFKEMMNRVGSYDLYGDIVDLYKNDPEYKLEDGSLNIPKLKEETLTRIFVEHVIKQNEDKTEKPELLAQTQTWWKRIIDSLRSFFTTGDFDPFRKAAKDFLKKEKAFKEGIEETVSKLKDFQPDSEDFDTFKNQTIKTFKEAASELSDNSVIVTHGTVISTLKTWKENDYDENEVPKEEFDQQEINNGHIEEMNIDGKTIYLVRHGESEANATDTESTPETPLTEKGKDDALKVARELKDKGISQIISTDTERTFDTANIIKKELGIKEDKFLQKPEDDKAKNIFDNIRATLQKFKHEITDKENYYLNLEESRRVKNRVTDRSKKIVEDTFPDEETAEQRMEWDQKATTGTRGHSDIEHVESRYIDKETGLARRSKDGNLEPLDKGDYVSQINPNDSRAYDVLEDFVRDIIGAYPEGTRFVWENPIYDAKNDEIGSPDLLVISKDGTVDIYDWKFLDIHENVKDIALYKKRAYNVQLKTYADILKKNYGVENTGKVRIMPIQAKYRKLPTGEFEFAGIEVGNSENNYRSETRDYLLPLPSEIEKYTENKKVQNYIDKLNTILRQMKKDIEKMSDQDLKKTYKQRMAEIIQSIRYLQVKKDVTASAESATAYLNEIGKKFKNYKDIFDEGRESEFTESDINRMSSEINRAENFISPFAGLEHLFKDEEDKDMLYNLSYRVKEAQDYINELKVLIGEKSIANKRNIYGFAGKNPFTDKPYADQMIDFFQKQWNSSSAAPTKAGQLFHLLRDEVYHKAEFDNQKIQDEYDTVTQPVLDWLKGRSRNILDKLLIKQGKDQWGLHDKYSKDFEPTLNKALKDGDFKFIKENVRVKDYMEDYEKRFDNYSKWADEYFSTYTDNAQKNKELAEEKKLEFQQKYDVLTYPKTAVKQSNDRLKKFPTDKWFSDEYKQLLKPENKPLLDYYNYLQQRFKEAHDMGILDHRWMSFLPMAPKSFVESLSWGGDKFKNVVRNIGSAFTIRPGDTGYTNPITREPEDRLLVRYISDLSTRDASGKDDYSNLSRDILALMPLFNLEMVKYKYASEVEDTLKLIGNIEKDKQVISKNAWGEPVVKDGEVQLKYSDENYKYFKFLMDSGYYGKSGTEDQRGWGFKWDYNKFANRVNSAMGSDMMPLSKEEEIFISVPKTISTLNRNISMKALGVNPVSALSNLFGGGIQSWFNANALEKKDFDIAKLIVGKANFLSTEEGKIIGGLLQYFSPYTSEETIQISRKYSLDEWNKWLSTNTLMTFMRKSDENVATINAVALMRNLMVKDGKVIGIWDSLKEKYNYANINRVSETERKSILEKMKTEYKELKEKNSIVKTAKIVDGKIEIPGLVDKMDPSVLNARANMQQMTRDALGNRTPYEKMQIDQNIFGASLMMFHHWIPPLVRTRFQNLNYVAGSKTYKWGRWKMLGAALHERGIGALGELVSHLTGDETSIRETALKLYEKKREQLRVTGELENFDANMTEADFVDMYMQGMKTNLYDALATLSLVSAYYFVIANAPDKDQEGRGWYKAGVKILDKFSDELAFFYSPASFYQLVGHARLPIISTAVDAYKFLKASGKELFYDIEGDQDAAEKNKVIRYPLQYVPAVNQMINWYSMFDDDMAIKMTGKKTPDQPIQPL